ncbi:MAG: flagellar basal body rod C-terminal domain-containing protein [Candidatus Baltobacteraceae bacterium]
MGSLEMLQTAAAGMEAQRAALDVAARNIAAAQAAGPLGSYERAVPQFRLTNDGDEPQIAFNGTRVERGSSVNALTEMVSVLNASRAYEANASVFEAGKQLALRTIDMGKV